ncbi:sensor domain-containing diguanylate cyclase [Roseateles saccharophilus]|uniref:PAS domain S-box-containing protein/diguanylate cyclase (GGDEF)-like protein n=1 Tax=Roseateles saccharophilus TaxID=304 RepID=A0A4R3VI83_ROSSA|nr:sensor domain-containing diguanylate cyclase [Roseateles saccharophilus]TCV03478.1 PAS domain S-box-containing protein/diguanylate cyclase (GGDEF)-like protein [Roseateles saccharophilus]
MSMATLASRPARQLLLRALILGAGYYLAGYLGLLIPYVGSHVSLFWLPTGIAMAAYWRWGAAMWPAVMAAAFAVNYQIGGPGWLAFGIAVGNALGPWLGAALLRRWSFDDALTRRRDLGAFLFADMAGMLATATNGTAWLWVAGLLPASNWPAAWMTWWTGDAVGALLCGIPLIALTPLAFRESFAGLRGAFNAGLLATVLVCGLIGFSAWTAPSAALLFPLLSLPLFVIAVLALRAGILAASSAVLILSATAAWGTANGVGPFAGHDTHAGLLALWSYITAQACTSVLICGLAAQLLATRRQQAALFRRASEAILVVGPTGLVGDLNPAAEELLGCSARDFHGRYLANLPFGNGGALARWMSDDVVPGASRLHQYLRLSRPDGSALEVEAQIAHHMDERGLLQAQIMLRDVTERREAEARVAASEKRLRDIADHAPALISEHDRQGHFRFANQAFQDWFHAEPAALIGKSLQEVIGRKAFAEMQQHIQAVLGGETVAFESRARNGRWLLIGLVPQRNAAGAVTGFYSLGSDFSAQARAEEALRQSEERYKAVLEDQADVVCRFDGKGEVVFANEACRRLVGGSAQHFAAATWRSVVVPEDLPQVHAQHKLLSPSNPIVVTEHRVVHAEQGVRWMEFVNHVFYDAHGKVREFQTVGRDVTQRKELKLQLEAINAQVLDLYDNAPCGYHSLNAEGKFVHINAVELSWLGCTRDEVIGRLGTVDFLTDESKLKYQTAFPEFLRTGAIEGVEYDLVSRNGTIRRVSLSATSVRDASGALVMSRSVMFDITEKHRIQAQLQRLSREQEAMLNTGVIGITRTRDRVFIWKNDAFERMLGYSPDELLGAPTRQLYADDESFQQFGREAYPAILAGRTFRTQIQLVRKDGSLIWVDMSGAQLDGGESVWLVQDITPLKQQQAHVERIAFHDPLTDLPNRLLLGDRLRQLIAMSERLQTMLAVCFIDLDGFKAINDAMGHEAGDLLLKEVARRLLLCVRGSDTVARLGGDEFVVVLSPLRAKEGCRPILARMGAELGKPVDLGGKQACVSASIGVAFFPGDGKAADVLTAHADEAMYRAKRSGRNRVCEW